jgi:uncharacterized protein (TIGR00369 family)
MSRISVREINEIIDEALPIAQLFGFRTEALTPGVAVVRLPFKRDLTRPGGTVSGPALMALADFAMYCAVMSLIGRVEDAVTTNLNMSFLRRPGPHDVLVEARVLKLGKRLAFLEAALKSEGDLVAHATGSYSLPQATATRDEKKPKPKRA